MSRRTAVVFPGQGSQVVGMGADLAKALPLARDVFSRASTILGYDLFKIMTEGPEASLHETRVSQPAIFVTNVALALCVGDVLQPIAAAGHSFGEFCALTIAGALTFDDALRLVQKRALAMGRAADALPGTMSAVLGLDAERLRAVVETVRAEPGVRVRLANFNSPSQIVVSGDRRGVEDQRPGGVCEAVERFDHRAEVTGSFMPEQRAGRGTRLCVEDCAGRSNACHSEVRRIWPGRRSTQILRGTSE